MREKDLLLDINHFSKVMEPPRACLLWGQISDTGSERNLNFPGTFQNLLPTTVGEEMQTPSNVKTPTWPQLTGSTRTRGDHVNVRLAWSVTTGKT